MMKRFAKIVLMMAAIAVFSLPAFAAVNEDFNSYTSPGTGYQTFTLNQFQWVNARCDTMTGATACTRPLPSNAVRIRNEASSLECIGLDGNGKDGGVGTITFEYMAWDTTPQAVNLVTMSVNGGAYTVLDTIKNKNCVGYSTYTKVVDNASDNIKIKVAWVSGERMHIDNFSITDFGGPTTETDAHVAIGGPGASPTISSLVDTQPEAQIVLTFDVYDAGNGEVGISTIINGITIGTDTASNTIANWALVMAGAELTDGITTWTGTINPGTIIFSGSPMLILPDGGATQTLTMTAWLVNPLPYYADNEVLGFKVKPSSFTTDPAGAGFDPTDAPVTSGVGNNVIDVVGTQLGITTQPLASVCKDQAFTVRAGFTDINGGVDEDYLPEAITLSVNTGTGLLSSVTGLTKVSTSGQSAWTDLKYSVAETGVILQATSVSFPTPVLTNTFNVALCPSVTVDARPLCWDGSAANTAVPFVIHVSIRDWLPNTDVYVKTYLGSANPYHYTAANGWSNSTSWTHKPTVTLDANGNWSGWLALKSNGMDSLRARAALTTSTGTYYTSDLFIGTLLDLTTTGVVVEDRDGVTSYADPNNIILARNGGGDILGSWIIEDNGYPLDDGGSAIAAGGWRLAMCDVCEDVTFESWLPENWPGYGVASFFDIAENFCPTPGTIVEMNDIILPVELISFAAVAGDRNVTLNWRTASETNNDHFVIVRDGADLATVDARGNATGHSYSWTEDGLDNGTNYSYTLVAVDVSGNRSELGAVNATPTESAALITEYALHQNYPNPFNPATQIRFDLVENGFVSLKVYNLMGQSVATVINGSMSAGSHTVSFDAATLPSGVYLYRLEVNGFAAEKKMLLMK